MHVLDQASPVGQKPERRTPEWLRLETLVITSRTDDGERMTKDVSPLTFRVSFLFFPPRSSIPANPVFFYGSSRKSRHLESSMGTHQKRKIPPVFPSFPKKTDVDR